MPETLPSPPKSRPLGGGGCERSEQTEGVPPPESPTGCIRTDISICCILWEKLIYQPDGIRTFFALLIYQFRPGSYLPEGSGNGRRREQRGRQSIKNYRRNGQCNRNYWNFCRSSHVASQIFMQVIEVYKLHSFSAQVYSFRQGRRISFKNKSNICTFSSCITVNCIFLFLVAFVIIIVYKGACAGPLHEDVFY